MITVDKSKSGTLSEQTTVDWCDWEIALVVEYCAAGRLAPATSGDTMVNDVSDGEIDAEGSSADCTCRSEGGGDGAMGLI